LRLAEEGANIIVTDINKEEAELVVQEIKGMGQDAIAIKCDVSKKAEITVLVEQSLEKFSKIDILVNNAGITKDGLFMRMKEEQWDLVMNINLKSIFLLSQEVFVKSMMKQKSGSIINISSLVGIIGNPGQVNYCAAKAGVIGFSKALSKEVSRWNIRVNAVAPGFIDTDMTRSMAEKYREELIKIIPMNRAGDASEVANTVLFFASDESSYITGQVLSVNGGTF
jgi:3-oxoacyl-[acyl-carrier protein] reductase